MSLLTEKFKEVLFSVLPVTLLVIILNFTVTPLESGLLIRFIIGAVSIIVGLSIFLIGVDRGITPLGSHMGSSIISINKIWIVGVAGLLLGFLVNIAEPDLHILAGQVDVVTSGMISKIVILTAVSLGIGIMLALGLVRIAFNIPLYWVLSGLYFIVLILSFFTTREFLAIAFDASGATTGALTVPLILALAIGVSSMKKDSKASEKDSFGLVAIVSTGAIMAVMIMSIITKTDEITGSLEQTLSGSGSVIGPFIHKIPIVAKEIAFALLPLLILLLIFQLSSFRISKRGFYRIIKGLLYTFFGLVLFLVGVNAGFMDVGAVVGFKIASLDNKLFVILTGLVLGLVTILAEPAVHVLTYQIENVTSGYIKRKVLLFALATGVGISVALSVVRILIPSIQLWHYLLPGYIAAIAMTFFTPKLFVGIAFDSGGVASGPMTATFVLAFTQGVAEKVESASVLVDGFGVIAMVALTPLITLQILGLIYKVKSAKGGLDDNAG